MIPQSLSYREFARILRMQANTSLMPPSTTHSLSNKIHSKMMNMEERISSTMLQTTANRSTRQKKVIMTNTSSDSLNSPQPLDNIEVMGVLEASEDAASEVEVISVAEEHP